MKTIARHFASAAIIGFAATSQLATFARAESTHFPGPSTVVASSHLAHSGKNPADGFRVSEVNKPTFEDYNKPEPDKMSGNDPILGNAPGLPQIPATEGQKVILAMSGANAQAPARNAAEIDSAVAALKEAVKTMDYQRAQYHPLHFAPAIAKADNRQCLVCHQEIATYKPRATSPAGLKAVDALAWYQTLDTYEGEQQSFHYRHLDSPLAKQVMNLSCNFCHQGNDPREESPDMALGRKVFTASANPDFTLRKMVNPSKTCLLCHGAMPDMDEIMAIGEDPWPVARADFEDEETPNGCLSCHEEIYRTVRHQVSYLKSANIEEAAKTGSDVCYGCHGGRQWYRISYPYPRNPWPDMDEEIPEWAVGRPTQSDPQYQLAPQAE